MTMTPEQLREAAVTIVGNSDRGYQERFREIINRFAGTSFDASRISAFFAGRRPVPPALELAIVKLIARRQGVEL